MKHEKTITATFVEVSYSCDLCKKDLLPGARPFECGICGRETCNNSLCSVWRSMEHGNFRMCEVCRGIEEHFLQGIAVAHAIFTQEEERLLQEWKEASLKNIERREI